MVSLDLLVKSLLALGALPSEVGRVIAAASTPIVLAILAEGDSYGCAILKRVRELSGGRMEWTDGMLYPVLHRLERLGHVEARWEVAESGRRRKYLVTKPVTTPPTHPFWRSCAPGAVASARCSTRWV